MKLLILFLISMLLLGCHSTAPPETTETVSTNISFSDATNASGIAFKHTAGQSEEKWMPEILGAGVAAVDINNDGNVDLVFTDSGLFGAEDPQKNGGHRLYLNDGKAKFTDATREWNLTSSGYGQAVAVGDFDNDGNTDLFFTSFEGDNRLLRNTGKKFEDVTEEAGIKKDNQWAASAGFGDFDNDGDLDIFVVKYVEYSKANHKATYNNKMPTYSAPYLYPGIKDQIWRNDGNGKFTDASKDFGLDDGRAEKGLALAIGDIDRDGDTDVYVANDTTPNQLWINEGTGKFVEKAGLTGSAYSETGKEEGSMGADFSDFDSNGFLDIAVTNFQGETTAVYSQTSEFLFRDVSDAVGVGETARSKLSFGLDFFDADNDGDEDLLVANGHIDDTVEKSSDSVKFAQQNTLYENDGKGKFTDISSGAGAGLALVKVSRGTAVADFDNDGDLDVAVANNNDIPSILLNESKSGGKSVSLLLRGKESNANAIGARIVAKIGETNIERQVLGANSYLSVSDFRVHFGLGSKDSVSGIEVVWPSGKKQTLGKLEAGKFYEVKEGEDAVVRSN